MRANFSAGVSPFTSATVAIAPALIMGLRGLPVPGSRLMELKASPDGSTSTLRSTFSMP